MISGGPTIGRRPEQPDGDASADASGSQGAVFSRVELISALLYAIGITLGAIGCLGAFMWVPLLWCAIAGLVVIAASFTISGGGFGRPQ